MKKTETEQLDRAVKLLGPNDPDVVARAETKIAIHFANEMMSKLHHHLDLTEERILNKTPKPKFKIGDTVLINCPFDKIIHGRLATIKDFTLRPEGIIYSFKEGIRNFNEAHLLPFINDSKGGSK